MKNGILLFFLPILVQCSTKLNTASTNASNQPAASPASSDTQALGRRVASPTRGSIRLLGTGLPETEFSRDCTCVYSEAQTAFSMECKGENRATDEETFAMIQIAKGFKTGTHKSPDANLISLLRQNNGLVVSTLGLGVNGSITIDKGGKVNGETTSGTLQGFKVIANDSSGSREIDVSARFLCVVENR